jgi:hypothetical protein
MTQSYGCGQKQTQRPRLNFINVLRAAFARADPERVKKQSSCQPFFRVQDLRE